MSEKGPGSEIPNSFDPENFVSDVVDLGYDSALLEEYIQTHLDSLTPDGGRNIERLRMMFQDLLEVLTDKTSTKDLQSLLGQIYAVGTKSPTIFGTKLHQEALARGWEELKSQLRVVGGLEGNHLLEDLGPVMDQIKFNPEQYQNLLEEAPEETPEEKSETDNEPKSEEGGGSEASPEAPAFGLGDLRSGVESVMASPASERHQELAKLLIKVEPSRLRELMEPIAYSNLGALEAMRNNPSPERREAMLALLGFERAPSAATFYTRIRVLSELMELAAGTAGATYGAALNTMGRALTNTYAITRFEMTPSEDFDYNPELSTVEKSDRTHYNRYFDVKETRESLRLDLDPLRQRMNQIFSAPDHAKKRLFAKFFGELEEAKVQTLLRPLLSRSMDNAGEHRKSPGDLQVRELILALTGSDAVPDGRVMFRRLAQILMMMDYLRPSPVAERFKEASLSALMHIVPDSFVYYVTDLKESGPERFSRKVMGRGSLEAEGPGYLDKTRAISKWASDRLGEVSTKDSPTEAEYAKEMGHRAVKGVARVIGGAAGLILDAGGAALRPLGPLNARWGHFNSITAINDFSQYQKFFELPARAEGGSGPDRPVPPVPPTPPEGGEARPEAGGEGGGGGGGGEREGGREGAPPSPRGARSYWDRGSEWIDKVAGTKVGTPLKVLMLGAVAAAGAEWTLRGVRTVAKTGWGLTTKGVRTGLNVAAVPFQRIGRHSRNMWQKGWSAIELPKKTELPANSPWYQRLGNSAWYTTKMAIKGSTAAALGGALAIGGAAWGSVEGTGAMFTEAAGIRYHKDVEDTEPSVEDVVKAVAGKLSEETIREIAEMKDPKEAIQKAIAELGEGALEVLKEGKVLSDKDPRAFGDHFGLVENAGAWAMAKELWDGAKELAVDNTMKSAKLEGTRWAVGGAGSLVLGNFTIPTLGEAVEFNKVLEDIGEKYLKAYDSYKHEPGFYKWFKAAAQLSPNDLGTAINTAVNTFDLAEPVQGQKPGFRTAFWGILPTVANLAANLENPERKESFKPEYGKGLGPYLAGLEEKHLKKFMEDSNTLDSLQIEHGFLINNTTETIDAQVARLGDYGVANLIKPTLLNFLGARAITPASAPIYIGKLEEAVKKINDLKNAEGTSDELKSMCEFTLQAYKNALYILKKNEYLAALSGVKLPAAA